jgi:hypothetical protein
MARTNALTVCLLACGLASADTASVTTRVLTLTANRQVKLVWFEPQSSAGDQEGKGSDHKLMGFDSHNGGVHEILAATGTYNKPLLTADGSRVVFSNLTTGKCYVVNWDGSGTVRTLVSGHALDAWRDPLNSEDWVYVRKSSGIWRCKMTDTTVSQLIWNRVATGNDGDGMYTQDYFQVSADGTHAVDQVNGWPNIGMMLLPNASVGYLHRTGCWSSMSPDNSYRALHRSADHWAVWLYNTPADTGHWVDLSAVTADWDAGQAGPCKYVSMIKWTTDPRFVAMVSPDVNEQTWDRSCAEVYLGRFDSTLSRLDGWARITYNSKADWQPDGWLADSATQPTQADTPVINLTPSDLGYSLQPGDTAGTARSVAVTNAGRGTLQTVSAGVQYGSGQTGWLALWVSGAGNSQSILNRVTTTGLDTGAHLATVTVSAANAAAWQYTVTLTLGSTPVLLDTGMHLIAPTGGEHLVVGQTIRVRWGMSVAGQGVSLYVSPDEGQAWYIITGLNSIAVADSNWGNFGWTIPASLQGHSLVSTTCMIKVAEYFRPTLFDESDSVFTISPATSIAPALTPLRPAADAVFAVYDLAGRRVRAMSPGAPTSYIRGLRPGVFLVQTRTQAGVVTARAACR